MAAGTAARAFVAPPSVGSCRGGALLRFPAVKVVNFSRAEGFVNGRVVLGVGRGDGFKASVVVSSSGRLKLNPSFGKCIKWWEKGVQPNMKEVSSAQDLVDSLLNAGDHLVVVAFFSPGCGGCRALHPKICQIAEKNPDLIFLHVNYEEHKSMCYSLHVHVLPFFRFYRGAQGRVSSFSCTNATIKKFKDALAKHRLERCSLGPSKGLEESELKALADNKDLNFVYTKKQEPVPVLADGGKIVLAAPMISFPPAPVSSDGSEEKHLVVHPRI